MSLTYHTILENMPSERNQSQKTTYCMIPFIWKTPNRQICGYKKEVRLFLQYRVFYKIFKDSVAILY